MGKLLDKNKIIADVKNTQRLHPRPIFVAYIGNHNIEMHNEIKNRLVNDLPDYYVIIVASKSEIKFEAFYPSDFNEIDLEALEAKLREAVAC